MQYLIVIVLFFSTSIIAGETVSVGSGVPTVSGVPTGMLDGSVIPKHYSLHLIMDPNKEAFQGEVIISIKVREPVRYFYMHGEDLSYHVAKLNDEIVSIKETGVEGVIKVSLSEVLSPGDYKLTINYDAKFGTDLAGIYRIKENENYYVYSQMQAISARKSIPSFDEPRFKTPFDITMTLPSSMKAITNSSDLTESINGDFKTVRFLTTKPIPTYLLAFAVGDFDVVEWKNLPKSEVRKEEIPFRGITVRGKGDQIHYALEHTWEVLNALEDYFQIPYPYEKLDILAVPAFDAGAMENVAAISYRESYILFDENTSIQQIRNFKYTHSHELAHQWFGNLVTPLWWNDLWLNEAFATWIGHVALDRHFPEGQWRRNLISGAQSAMAADSLPSARKIRNPIQNNVDINDAFDFITYEKGGGVLSMIELAVGPEKFREGVNRYLNKYRWSNADAFDFISSLMEVVEEDRAVVLAEVLKDFISVKGVPQISLTSKCEDNVTKVSIVQKRYAPLGTDFKESNQWKVPVCLSYLASGKVNNQCEIILSKTHQMELNAKGCAAYIMPNAQGAGYYRFNLDKSAWENLMVNLEKLPAAEAGSAMDSFGSVFMSGDITLSDYLDVLPATLKSNSWEANISGIPKLISLLKYADKKDEKVLKEIFRNIYIEAADSIGLEAITELDRLAPRDAEQLRKSYVGFMVNNLNDANYQAALSEAGQKYIGFGGSNQISEGAIDPALVRVALEAAIQEVGLPFAKALLEMAMSSRNDTFHSNAYSALSGTKRHEIAKYLLPYTVDERVKENRAIVLLVGLSREAAVKEVSWPWLKDNFASVRERFPVAYGSLWVLLFNRECSQEGLDRMDDLLKPVIEKIDGAESNYNKVSEAIHQCIAQKNHFRPQIKSLVNANG